MTNVCEIGLEGLLENGVINRKAYIRFQVNMCRVHFEGGSLEEGFKFPVIKILRDVAATTDGMEMGASGHITFAGWGRLRRMMN